MARIRTIKPDFWTDEKIVDLSAFARLLFIGLWNFADDDGRMEFSPKRIKMQIFPADSVEPSELFDELRRAKLINVYSIDNKEYLQIVNFEKHQKVDKRSASKFPPPPTPAELPRVPPTEGKGMEVEGNGSNSDPNGSVVAAEADDPAEPEEIPDIDKGNGTARPPPLPVQDAFDNWNTVAAELRLPKAKLLSPDRRRKLAARLRDCGGIEGWNEALLQIENSPFLRGKNDNGFQADLDFMLQPKSFNRLREGFYAAKEFEP